MARKHGWPYMAAAGLSLVLASVLWTTLVAAASESSEICLRPSGFEQGDGDLWVGTLTVTRETGGSDRPVEITIDVWNDRTEAGSFSVILRIKRPGATEFEPIDVTEITLRGCETGTSSFFVHLEELGRYEVEIEGLTGAFDVLRNTDPTDSLLFLAKNPTGFVAENLVVTPTAVAPGESVKITVDIINEGARPGAFNSILKLKSPGRVEFEPIAVKEITLLAGESGVITFFAEGEELGRYEVETQGRTGAFDVGRKIDPSNFRFSDLSITPSAVQPGEPVKVSMSVENLGDEDGRADIEFRINGVVHELRSLSVPASGRADVIFDFAPPAEGTYTVELIDPEEKLQPLRGELRAVIQKSPAHFTVSRLDIVPLDAGPGEEVTVAFEISNVGETPGKLALVLLLNGEEVTRQEYILVDTLATEPVVFTIAAPPKAGEYTVKIQDIDVTGSFRVVETVVATLRIVSLDVAPGLMDVGDDVTVVVVVENAFGQPATGKLSVTLDGTVIEEMTLELGAGETRKETFIIPEPTVGPHVVEIEGISSKFEVRERVIERLAILNLVAPLTVSPMEGQPGEPVTITVIVANQGDEDGQTDVILRVSGQVIERRVVLVPGQQEESLKFEVRPVEEGEYDVAVEAVEAMEVRVLEGTFTTAISHLKPTRKLTPTPSATPTPTPEPPKTGVGFSSCSARAGDDGTVEVSLVAVLVGLVSLSVSRRRRFH